MTTKTNTRRLSQQLASEFAQIRSEGYGLCECIRTLVAMYEPEELSVAEVIAALPEMNPATIRIQFRKSRQITAEMESSTNAGAVKKESPRKGEGSLTQLEQEAFAAMVESSGDTGHDFGIVEEVEWSGSRKQLGGLITNLVQKDLVKVYEREAVNGGPKHGGHWVTQFVLTEKGFKLAGIER